MWPNPKFPVDLVTFTEEILNGKLHFLCSELWLGWLTIRCLLLSKMEQNDKQNKILKWRIYFN